MNADFDHIANNYDAEFTQSLVGKAQRELVSTHLDNLIPDWNGLEVLELNCGTGEDALYFGQKGASVLATDISSEMVKVAKIKNREQNNVQCKQMDILDILSQMGSKKFDLIFSNFGGLNCLNQTELKQFLDTSKKLLRPNGKLIMVVMPKFCVWESVYFLAKLQLKKAFRRKIKKGVLANVDGKDVRTYYYSPLQFVKWAKAFKMEFVAPIGLFIPPSYLNSLFLKKDKMIEKMREIDKKQADSFHLSGLSDHFFISFTLR
ncbi:MAG: class I SAM-dependent DNA methyltransferase [Salibacteraceae bacterium]